MQLDFFDQNPQKSQIPQPEVKPRAEQKNTMHGLMQADEWVFQKVHPYKVFKQSAYVTWILNE